MLAGRQDQCLQDQGAGQQSGAGRYAAIALK
jgi:hypothetical protein